MGDNDKGLAELVTQVEEQPVQVFLVLGVEGAGGLVGQDHGRVVHQCPSHSDTLLLTARQFVGLMRGTVTQSHKTQQFLGTALGSLLRFPGDIGRNHDVLNRRELRQQLMELEHKAQMGVPEVRQAFRRQ